MGVTSLWSVVQPCARPIKIETLNRKRLAVDASIWIYQFLKAVRDKEGNALRNSHVIGFFRRICKLLFIGIKPVFVFDGGAPALKRQTISHRKQRREGRRDDAVRTAGKLLALQMQRRAEEDEEKAKRAKEGAPIAAEEEEVLPESLTYVDEIGKSEEQRKKERRFKKKDQYHLPELDASMAEMGGPNDPRVMSIEDLEAYARQFDSGEDINLYDFSKIDFDGPFFMSLPASDRYNILNAARLRSRLRMGYSKDQLDTMFPDRMAFSRFQIERVTERNDLTQRLMNINGMNDGITTFDSTGRIAGEKGREYVLVKNDGVEGGWALGVIGDKDEGKRNKPIDIEEQERREARLAEVASSESEDDGFEDIPIEGLNRLPKRKGRPAHETLENQPFSGDSDVAQRRKALYEARQRAAERRGGPQKQAREDDPDSLFVGQTSKVDIEDSDDEELHKAIAMSLESNRADSEMDDDDFEEVFSKPQTKVSDSTSYFQDGKGTVASLANSRSRQAQQPVPQTAADDDMDIAAALAESRQSKQKSHKRQTSASPKPFGQSTKDFEQSQTNQFSGPLPFESLDLGSSILGKKKMKQIEENQAGGFEKDVRKDETKKSAPLPPWFAGKLDSDMASQKLLEEEDRRKAREEEEAAALEDQFEFREEPKLSRMDKQEIIDVDEVQPTSRGPIMIESSDDEAAQNDKPEGNVIVQDSEVRMGDLADLARVEPPVEPSHPQASPVVTPSPKHAVTEINEQSVSPQGNQEEQQTTKVDQPNDEEDGLMLEWEDSENEEIVQPSPSLKPIKKPAGGVIDRPVTRSPSMEFENVDMVTDKNASEVKEIDESDTVDEHKEFDALDAGHAPKTGTADQEMPHVEGEEDDQDYYSDGSDEELMLALATEAEEHARFASTLNPQKTKAQNIEEYERELKALRSQQKKDRRDADEVTHIMVTECQQLLRLFGLPYITAPMEAEAQCAELVRLSLVDGIVTDDSDIFLFGGTRVYKNMFNQAKFVECYLTSDLEKEFDLTRARLIRIAHLLGSDYTPGLPGVGPVTALEILSEFPDGLDAFKAWWHHVQTGTPASVTDRASPFRRKFRRQSAKLFLPPVFPDLRVDQAYLHPEVDADPQQFAWGVPDLDALRSFLMATIGWSQERTDEVLVPVIRDMNRRETEGTQSNITAFLGAGSTVGVGAAASSASAFAPRRRGGASKRMEGALEKLAGRARKRRKGVEEADIVEEEQSGNGKGSGEAQPVAKANGDGDDKEGDGVAERKERKKMNGQRTSAAVSVEEEDDDDGDYKQAKPKKRRKGVKRRGKG